jgi:hypothetical protein
MSSEEKSNLDEQLKSYWAKVQEVEKDAKESDLSMELTESQANFLLEQIDDKISQLARKDFGIIRIFPDGERAKIILSIQIKDKRFLNVTSSGTPSVESGVFHMKFDSIQAGRLKNAEFMKDSILQRMNNQITEMPGVLSLPFKIDTIKIKDSKVYLKLKLLQRG